MHLFRVTECIPACVWIKLSVGCRTLSENRPSERAVYRNTLVIFRDISRFNLNHLQPLALNPASREFYEIEPHTDPLGVDCLMGDMTNRDLLVSMRLDLGQNEFKFTHQGTVLLPGGGGHTMDHRVYTGLVGPDPAVFQCLDYNTKMEWETVANPNYTKFFRSYQCLQNRTR